MESSLVTAATRIQLPPEEERTKMANTCWLRLRGCRAVPAVLIHLRDLKSTTSSPQPRFDISLDALKHYTKRDPRDSEQLLKQVQKVQQSQARACSGGH
ncbi:hypothetical protein AOLI_G00178400 [Acnodon oligacanthus]